MEKWFKGVSMAFLSAMMLVLGVPAASSATTGEAGTLG